VIRKLFRVLLVLWAGSLWSLALGDLDPVPCAERSASGRRAGGTAVQHRDLRGGRRGCAGAAAAGRLKFAWGYFAASLLALNEWGLRRVMDAARVHGAAAGLTFGAWHGVSMVLY
jgi:hypothetical protein